MAEKVELVAAYRRSGLTQRAFARREGMPAANLSRWARAARRTRPDEGPLIELAMASAPLNMGVLAIQTPGGLKLEVLPGTDPAWLGQLLANLRSC